MTGYGTGFETEIIDFDYKNYTNQNLENFNKTYQSLGL